MRRLRKNFHAKGVRAIILFAGGGGCPRLIFDNFHYVNIIGLNFLETGGYEPSPSLELPPPCIRTFKMNQCAIVIIMISIITQY